MINPQLANVPVLLVTDARKPRKRRARSHFPASVALVLQRELEDYIELLGQAALQQVVQLLRPLLPDGARSDANAEEIRALLEGLYRNLLAVISEDQVERIARRAITQATLRSLEQVRRELGRVRLPGVVGGSAQIEFLLPPGRMHEISEARVAELVRLIRTIPDRYSEQLERLVHEAVSQGSGYSSLARQIRELTETTRYRAKTIAVDQINRAYSSIAQERMERIGVEHVIWITARDDRVCSICLPLDQEKFLLSDLQRKGWPPRHPLCRCTTIADPEELKQIAGGFI